LGVYLGGGGEARANRRSKLQATRSAGTVRVWVRLDAYLTDKGQREALDIRELLQKQDWEPSEARY